MLASNLNQPEHTQLARPSFHIDIEKAKEAT